LCTGIPKNRFTRRVSFGIATVGGLIVSQLLTLYTTPVIYLALDRLRQRWALRRRRAGNLPALDWQTLPAFRGLIYAERGSTRWFLGGIAKSYDRGVERRLERKEPLI
jgi:hypothetical protein